jgi:hypothetical protein
LAGRFGVNRRECGAKLRRQCANRAGRTTLGLVTGRPSPRAGGERVPGGRVRGARAAKKTGSSRATALPSPGGGATQCLPVP